MKLTTQDYHRLDYGVTFKRYNQEFVIQDISHSGYYCKALAGSKFCKEGDCQWFPINRLVKLVRNSQLKKNLGIY